jgi:uncharacterized damage-inducible protein DinB
MKRCFLCLFCFLALAILPAAAQSVGKDAKFTIAGEVNKNIGWPESEMVPAADAMPEDKYEFAPTHGEFKGVRTFSQQVKHIAAVNYIIGAAILGEKPPVDTGGESGPDSLNAKADILKFAKDSFAYLHKAAGSITAENALVPVKSPFGDGMTTRLAMGGSAAAHVFDHYGQMVVYLRLNGIIPPASRK